MPVLRSNTLMGVSFRKKIFTYLGARLRSTPLTGASSRKRRAYFPDLKFGEITLLDFARVTLPPRASISSSVRFCASTA